MFFKHIINDNTAFVKGYVFSFLTKVRRAVYNNPGINSEVLIWKNASL